MRRMKYKTITAAITIAIVAFILPCASILSSAGAGMSAASAAPTASTVVVDGRDIVFDAYNIAGYNYFKLRDLALQLDGSPKQFAVGWDEAGDSIAITSGSGYVAVGGEMMGKGAEAKLAAPTSSKIFLDGEQTWFEAYIIEGNNYFKLRDIGRALDFGVDWDGDRDMITIDTGKGYTEEGDDSSGDNSGKAKDSESQGPLPVPVGNAIYNNGGAVVQFGDCFYFSAEEYDAQSESYKYGIYVRREGDAEKYRLLETEWMSDHIYIIDDNLIATNWLDQHYAMHRINIINGEADLQFFVASINHVDYEAREIYYTKPFLGDEGLYKSNFDGSGEHFLCHVKYEFIHKEGDVIYLQDISFDGGATHYAVLYTMKSDGTGLAKLAEIPALHDDLEEYNYSGDDYIQHMELAPGWIYMTVGNHQGSAGFFFGGLARVRRDGSAAEWIMALESTEFFIMDGWLYYNATSDEPPNENVYGGQRISLGDLSVKEYLGSDIYSLLNCAGGRLYYDGSLDFDTSALRSRAAPGAPGTPGSAEDVLLFDWEWLPEFEHFYYSYFRNVQPDGGYVFFTIYVKGYVDQDGWRGHDEYVAHYRVRADGTGLTLINESNICPW